MHLVDSYKRNIFSFCLKMSSEMSGECKSTSKLIYDVCHITVTILLMVNCEMLIVEVCGKGLQLVSKLFQQDECCHEISR